MISIDGARGEGGGQILRTALAMSAITGQALHIYNIRGRRPKPVITSYSIHYTKLYEFAACTLQEDILLRRGLVTVTGRDRHTFDA